MRIKRRKSRQRENIYELVRDSASHPTALWVYHQIRKKNVKTSLGNVYRNLKILVDEGRIKCREFNDGIERYDAILGLHYHFICEKCNDVSDFHLPVQESIIRKAQKKTDSIITGHTIQFFGICSKCRGNKNQKMSTEKKQTKSK